MENKCKKQKKKERKHYAENLMISWSQPDTT